MRIGIDASPLRAQGGGIRRYTEHLIRGLARIDRSNEYILFGAKSRVDGLELGSNFAWDRIDFPMKSWLDRFHMVGAPGKIDLFHGTNYLAPLLDRFPTVLTIHDLSVHLFPENHPRWRRLSHCLLPGLCRRSARIIADSFNTRADLVRHYRVPEDKIDVVHLAASQEYRPVREPAELDRVRQRYALPESFVLFLGVVEPRKNLPALIAAIGELFREGTPRRLVIAGGGQRKYVECLREVVRREGLELDRDVVITGYVERRDLPALYSSCEVFVYPSLYEGFGLPPVEAMACGAPVIVSRNSSLEEIFRDSSMMVDLAQPGALAAAVRRVLQDPAQRAQLVGAGLEYARSRTWDAVAAETLEVYSRAMARG